MDLVDLPTPLYVRGRYLADIFMGQMRLYALTDKRRRFLKRRYEEMELDKEGIQLSDFLHAFERIPHRSLRGIRGLDVALRELVNAIGRTLEEAYGVRAVNDLSGELLSINDLDTGLATVCDEVKDALNADSCSIWLYYRGPSRPGFGFPSALRPVIIRWFGDPEDEGLKGRLAISPAETERGLAGWILSDRSTPLILSTKEEICSKPAVYEEYRTRRDLGSFAGIRIESAGTLIGFLEFGSHREGHFRQDDSDLFMTIGQLAASFIRRTREREIVIEIHNSPSRSHLLSHLTTEIPLLFGSLTASFYLPTEERGRPVLQPFSSDQVVRGLGPGGSRHDWAPTYDVETCEGLTGYVAKYCTCLRLADCADVGEIARLYREGAFRDPNGKVPPEAPVWKGKTRTRAEALQERQSYPVMICPCLDDVGQLRAVLQIIYKETGVFHRSDEIYAMSLCHQIALRLKHFSLRLGELEMVRHGMKDVSAAFIGWMDSLYEGVTQGASREETLRHLLRAFESALEIAGGCGIAGTDITDPAELPCIDVGTFYTNWLLDRMDFYRHFASLAGKSFWFPEPDDLGRDVLSKEFRADFGLVSGVLDVLVINAVKHGGAKIEFGVAHCHGSLRFFIVDDGPGVPPHILAGICADSSSGFGAKPAGFGLRACAAALRDSGFHLDVRRNARGRTEVAMVIPTTSRGRTDTKGDRHA